MKNIIAASLFAFTLLACNKTEKTIVKSDSAKDSIETKTVKFTVDSINVQDSLAESKIIKLKYDATVLVFPSLADKKLLDSIYSQEKLMLADYNKANLEKALNQKMKEYFADNKVSSKDYPGDFPQTWNQTSDMEVSQKTNDFLTIKYTGDGFSGGAHGYYYEFYKNFNLKNNATLQFKDIVTTTDSKIWEPILLKSFLKDKDNTLDLLFDKKIPLNDNFYFDKNSLHFFYNQYEIAPYSSGPIDIAIPFSEITQYLTPEFKTAQNIK
jgi:hypothetical protein